jgi:hypothetical protein
MAEYGGLKVPSSRVHIGIEFADNIECEADAVKISKVGT